MSSNLENIVVERKKVVGNGSDDNNYKHDYRDDFTRKNEDQLRYLTVDDAKQDAENIKKYRNEQKINAKEKKLRKIVVMIATVILMMETMIRIVTGRLY